jgi:predicted transcriptional regulator
MPCGGQRCFGAVDGQRLRGLLTLTDITTVPQERWRTVTTEDVMVPWEKVIRVQPDTELWTALQITDEANVGQVPVIKENTIVGVLSHERVLHYIRLRTALRI